MRSQKKGNYDDNGDDGNCVVVMGRGGGKGWLYFGVSDRGWV